MISEELTQKPKPWFIIISIVTFAGILFFSIYYEIQQGRLKNAIGEMQAKKEALSTNQQEENASNARARALTAKEYLQELEKKQVIWSKIVEKIESVIPRNTETNTPFVLFRSYSGSSEGRLAINATTLPTAADPFNDIALTVRAFTSDQTFKNVFIPSIAKSLTPDGQTITSFSMNFEYNPQNLLTRPRSEQAQDSEQAQKKEQASIEPLENLPTQSTQSSSPQ